MSRSFPELVLDDPAEALAAAALARLDRPGTGRGLPPQGRGESERHVRPLPVVVVGRLMEGRNTSNQAAVTKYRYNGLGYRIMMQYDVDADTSLENDERRYFCYDERWRVIATFKNASTDPKERYVHHAAGGRGLGGSSYIDSVVMRERDTTVPWTGSTGSDSSLDERLYYAQNWRADAVAIFGTDADVKEWVKYSSYGVPHCIPKGDYDIDGDVDAADTTALEAMVGGSGGWAVDFNHDAALNGTDVEEHETYRTGYSGGTGGRGVQSRSGVDNMLGYAGYVWDGIVSANHVRHRVYRPEIGRWTRRDPAGYVDGANVYSYSQSSPAMYVDPFGLLTSPCIAWEPRLVSHSTGTATQFIPGIIVDAGILSIKVGSSTYTVAATHDQITATLAIPVTTSWFGLAGATTTLIQGPVGYKFSCKKGTDSAGATVIDLLATTIGSGAESVRDVSPTLGNRLDVGYGLFAYAHPVDRSTTDVEFRYRVAVTHGLTGGIRVGPVSLDWDIGRTLLDTGIVSDGMYRYSCACCAWYDVPTRTLVDMCRRRSRIVWPYFPFYPGPITINPPP